MILFYQTGLLNLVQETSVHQNPVFAVSEEWEPLSGMDNSQKFKKKR